MRRRLAVITGGHPFQVPEFHDLVEEACGGEFRPFVQHLDEFTTSSASTRRSYDAALFYCFPQVRPAATAAAAIEDLLDAGQGCVVLHHALLAFPDWPTWDDVVGCAGRHRFTFHADTRYLAERADDLHPVADGMASWEMVDETYVMPDPVGTPLLQVSHPLSTRVIAWSRACRRSRVVGLQPGHGTGAWQHPTYRRLLARAIAWTAGGTSTAC